MDLSGEEEFVLFFSIISVQMECALAGFKVFEQKIVGMRAWVSLKSSYGAKTV